MLLFYGALGPLRRFAAEICRVVDAAGAFVLRHLGIRAELSCPIDPAAGAVRRDDALRRFAALDPPVQGADFIEGIGPVATAAVGHPRRHEEADALVGLLRTQRLAHAAEVL